MNKYSLASDVGGDLAPACHYWFAKTTHSITAEALVDTIAPKWISRDRSVEILTDRRRNRLCIPSPSERSSFLPGQHTRRTISSTSPPLTTCIFLHFTSLLHFIALFLYSSWEGSRVTERLEGRRTTESRGRSFIVLSSSFIRSRHLSLSLYSR